MSNGEPRTGCKALGATAVRSLVGKPVAIAKIHGSPMELSDGTRLVATIHPSYLLRIQDADDKAAEYRRFVGDLRGCAKLMPSVAG